MRLPPGFTYVRRVNPGLADQRLGSLVLGGYDKSRIKGAPAGFNMTNNSAMGSNLLVSVHSLTIQYSDGNGPASAPGASFEAVIDSTLPYLFLPNATCDWLKDELGLGYDTSTNLYTINQTSLDSNRANIASFAISLGPNSHSTIESDSLISINLPYDALNADADWWWGFNGPQAIFPILRAQSNTAVLGRPFFQEAYVSADYERGVFNVSQTQSGSQASIVPLYNVSTQAQIDSHHAKKLSPGAIAGAVTGPLAALVAIALFIWWWFFKRAGRKGAQDGDQRDALEMSKEAAARLRRGTFESMSTEVTEIGTSDVRPGHSRHLSGVSELSSDSDAARRRNTLSGLEDVHELHEMEGEDKNDTAEWAMNLRRMQQPAELEGEGHLMRPLG